MFILLRASLLLLAPLGFLALFVGNRISTQALSRARRAGSLAVRCLLVLLLTCALGGPVWTHITDLRRHTVFLVDVSESVPAAARDRALAELKPQWDREVAEGNLCSMMAFAGASRVLIPPGRAPLQIPAIPTDDGLRRSATDFSSAFAAARTLFQSQAANRIVVLTDGLESTQPANRVEIPPDTLAVPLTEDRGNDLAIVDVQAPLAVRSGEPFDVRVSVATERAGEFGLSVVLDNEALPGASKRYSAPGPGRHVVMLPPLQQKTSFASGLHKLLVMAEAPGDREPRNNIGLA
ncbi:MAG TPA: VWA domain-containing protein, partial [Planctomycetota bacterium]|nr:VWA domain-containing protein [Planctomycetota bacterium]